MTAPSRIIDMHQHVCWLGRDDAGLVADMDARGIARTVLLNWDITPLEFADSYEGALNPVHVVPGRPQHRGLPLADIVQAVRRYPERLIPAYCPHPLDPHAVEHLDAALRMYGVKLCGEWKATVCLDDPRCLNLFRFCGENHLPVLFHIDVPFVVDPETGQEKYRRQWYGGTIDNVQRAVEACPETIFVGHGPGFWRYISGDAESAQGGYPSGKVVPGGRIMDLLDGYENFYCDLSANSGHNALNRDIEHARQFLLKYHHRLVFGRDGYDGKLHELLQSLDLPAEVLENIYHRNAERLLRLEP